MGWQSSLYYRRRIFSSKSRKESFILASTNEGLEVRQLEAQHPWQAGIEKMDGPQARGLGSFLLWLNLFCFVDGWKEPEGDPSAPWAAYTGEIGPTSSNGKTSRWGASEYSQSEDKGRRQEPDKASFKEVRSYATRKRGVRMPTTTGEGLPQDRSEMHLLYNANVWIEPCDT